MAASSVYSSWLTSPRNSVRRRSSAFTEDELTGKLDEFFILPGEATGSGWQKVPGARVTITGQLSDDGFVGSGQLDADFSLLGAWNVKRNQVPGLTPTLPDLPEFSLQGEFVKNASEAVGAVETITPLVAVNGTSSGVFSASMSFGGTVGKYDWSGGRSTAATKGYSRDNPSAEDLLDHWNDPNRIWTFQRLSTFSLSGIPRWEIPERKGALWTLLDDSGGNRFPNVRWEDLELLGTRDGITYGQWKAGPAGTLNIEFDMRFQPNYVAPEIRAAIEREGKLWSWRL